VDARTVRVLAQREQRVARAAGGLGRGDRLDAGERRALDQVEARRQAPRIEQQPPRVRAGDLEADAGEAGGARA
jgi:hypothetical protein